MADITQHQDNTHLLEALMLLQQPLNEVLPEVFVPKTRKELADVPQEQLEMFFRALRTVAPSEIRLSEEYFACQDAFLQQKLAEANDKNQVATLADVTVTAHPQLSVWRGDITRLEVDAIQNAANAQMLGCFSPGHACIDNAIHSAAGLQLRLACAESMRASGTSAEPTGQARVTAGFNLPAEWVIHTVGPIVAPRPFPSKPQEQQLASSYRETLRAAVEVGASSVALCCVSTGVFGYPKDAGADVAVATTRAFLQELVDEGHPAAGDLKVVFNVFSEDDYERYVARLG